MTTNNIHRVHGEATMPSVIWPAEELSMLLAVPPIPCPPNCTLAGCKGAAWERACARIFLAANGWTAHRGRRPRRFGGLDVEREVLPLLDHFAMVRERGRQLTIGF